MIPDGPKDPAEPVVTSLHYYPIKSCAGTSVDTLTCDMLGPVHDRRFMLIDEDDTFLSQRDLPKMSLIKPEIREDHLSVSAPGMETLQVPLHPTGGKSKARIWSDVVEVRGVTTQAAEWLSEYLGIRCRLVHLPDETIRPVDPDYATPDDRVSLADGFPFLVISEASLEDLNSRLDEPLPMNRFRPNIVVSGTEPYEEDSWTKIRTGEMEFRVAKPCARCAITTVEQTTGMKGKEPLTTLAKYRNSPRGVLFGQNLVHEEPGMLKIGDVVEVVRLH